MDREGGKWFKVRIALILLACTAGLVAVVHKAYRLQIVEGAKFRQMAEEQYTKEIELPARRGVIADRNGVELAVSMAVDSVFLQPKYFQKKNKGRLKEAVTGLAVAFQMNPSAIFEKLNTPRHFVWLKRQISPAEQAAIAKLGLEGVSTIKEFKRYYPLRNLAAHVIGFTDIDGQGQGGVEKYFNLSLRGQVQVVNGYRDAKGRDLFDQDMVSEAELEGHRIELTIDSNVQRVTEEELDKAIKEHGGVGGIAVVMDPRTGELLALANSPSFDPNDPSKFSEKSWNNQALTNPFEPGSTMKSFVLSAALQEKVVKPEDRFDCENGKYAIGSRVIHDDHKKGVLTVTETIKYSSNICAAKIGLKMGRDRLYQSLRSFGFGELSGVALPAETRGLLPHKSRWADINTATISFGQGVSVSAMQLAGAFAMIANGGNLMTPQIVRRVLNRKGEVVKEFEPEIRRTPLSPQVTRKVAEILSTVTEIGGTGTAAAVDGFMVAGKTGTAQKVDSATKGYSVDKRIGLFAGFVPALDPRLVVVVAIDEPKGIKYGGVVAAPAFRSIATAALRNYGVFPKAGAAAMAGREKGAPADGDGGGGDDGEAAADDGYVDEIGAGDLTGVDTVPRFIGLPMRKVVEMSVDSGIELEVTGSGWAVSQDPLPGSKYKQGSVCRVVFSKG
jgi:cell division protein FtsI (penicillin-binding protein 3)